MTKPRPPAEGRRRQPAQARARHTVQAILEAAVQVFERHGFAAGTTARIAERAGVSVGSLYQYFPDKSAILSALGRRHLAEVEAVSHRLLADLAATPLPLAAAIERVVEGFLALHRDHPTLHRLLYDDSLLPPEIPAALAALEARLVDEVAALLAAHPDVRPGSGRLQAWFVVHLVGQFAHALVTAPPDARPSDAAAELRELLRRYLAA